VIYCNKIYNLIYIAMSNKYGFAHQDLETVIIRGKGANIKKQKERTGETATQKKFDTTHSNAMRKLDENGETFKVDKVNPKVSKAIIDGRTAKKWKRADLAMRCQLTVAIITEYETGKAKPNIGQIKKMEKALGVKLTGAEFK
jgi:ribosome-binding protein aMBF1 (putative translation factor)